jgi:hypothetical protein
LSIQVVVCAVFGESTKVNKTGRRTRKRRRGRVSLFICPLFRGFLTKERKGKEEEEEARRFLLFVIEERKERKKKTIKKSVQQ